MPPTVRPLPAVAVILTLLALTVLALALPASVPRAYAAMAGARTGAPPRHAVLVGVPGLRWSDVSESATPNLWRLAGRAGAGVLSVRAVGHLTCPNDGWVTVSAGLRSAAGTYCHRRLTVTPRGGGATVAGLAELRRINAGFGAVGLLGDTVRRAGGCTTAVGPGAALAAADAAGHVGTYAARPAALPATAWARCPVTVVDAGAVGGAGRAAAVRRADAVVGAVLARIPADASVIVAGVADDVPDAVHGAVAGAGRQPHLRLLLATGPGTAGRYVGSVSTRRPDMAILPDLTATVLASAGLPRPAGMAGAPLRPGAGRPAAVASTVAALRAEDVAAQTVRRLLPRFFAGFVIGQLLLYGAAAVALRRRWPARWRGRILAATRLTALTAAAVPVAAYLVNLVPWWRADRPLLTLLGTLAALDALVVVAAVRGPWRRGVLGAGTFVAALTATVIGLDLVTGSRLQLNSLMGYSPLAGGRYYGIGNIAFAVLATSTLLAAAGAAQWLAPRRGRRAALAAVLAMTLTAAVLDGWTAWGSDFGGVIAFVPGLATTAVLVRGGRVTFLRLQLLRAAGMAIVLGVAYLDSLRPPSQETHMGRFFDDLVRGNALPWLERKFTAMVHTFGNPTLVPIVVAAFLFVYLVLHRPGLTGAAGLRLAYERAPMLRAGLSGVFVTALVGGAVNDSGIAVPALALAVAVPLALAATVRAMAADGAAETAVRRVPGTALRPAEG